MGDDSCLGPSKLFSQSGNPASKTDGDVGNVVITFSNITHLAGFVVSQTPSIFIFSSRRAFAIYLCFATSLDNDKAGFRGNLSLFFSLKKSTDLLIQLLICKKSSCFTGLHWCVGTVGTDPSELSLCLLNPYVTHPAVRRGYTRSSLEKS